MARNRLSPSHPVPGTRRSVRLRTRLWAATLALSLLSGAAQADDPDMVASMNPGSLLIFPEFDNSTGVFTIFTLTNTFQGPPEDPIEVSINYVSADPGLNFCQVADADVDLTPNDTVSIVTKAAVEEFDRGYIFCFTRKDFTGNPDVPIAFNWIIGTSVVLDGVNGLAYGLNPFVFGSPIPEGMPTDVDNAGAGDGIRDLNGIEYHQVPDMFYFPRYLGQGWNPYGNVHDQLIMLNLTGGVQFTTTLDLLSYNDNEEVFSKTFSFQCWDKRALSVVSGAFNDDFLEMFTNHNPDEVLGWDTGPETGWFSLDGRVSNGTIFGTLDPAFLAVLIEYRGANRAAASLPFGAGCQADGDILPFGLDEDVLD